MTAGEARAAALPWPHPRGCAGVFGDVPAVTAARAGEGQLGPGGAAPSRYRSPGPRGTTAPSEIRGERNRQ